jgi:hypothetical protein
MKNYKCLIVNYLPVLGSFLSYCHYIYIKEETLIPFFISGIKFSIETAETVGLYVID